jgi:nicotinamide-nucleotide amidase
MKEMVTGTVLPDLRRRSGQSAVIRSRTLRTWGLSESGIDEMLTERMAALDISGNPTIAFNASGIEGIKVRVTAKCDDEATAFKLLDAEEKIIRGVLGDAVFGLDEQAMEDVVLGLLEQRGLTLAAHETITGGILATRMTARDVAHATFRGATVANDPGAAGGPPEQRAAKAAASARAAFEADVGLAAISPAPEEGHPAGTIFQAVVLKNTTDAGSGVDKVILFSDRPRQREYAVISLLNNLRRALMAG